MSGLRFALPLFAVFGAFPAYAQGTAQGTLVLTQNLWGDFLAGYHAEATGDNTKALEYYGLATRKGMPASTDLHNRMYILSLTEGHLDDALQSLQLADQKDAKVPMANLALAVKAMRDGDFAGAEALLADDDSGISRILAPVITAWAKVGRKDMAGALAALDKLQDTPDDAASPLHILHGALINELAGNQEAAQALFDKLREVTTTSIRTAELVGQHLERRGLTQDARAVYEGLGDDGERLIMMEGLDARQKARKAPPLNIDTAQKGAAEALYGVASALLAQNALESALALSHMAMTLWSDYPPAAMVAAAALQQGNRHAEANALYAAIAPTSPFSWMARLRMANNLDQMGQTERAIDSLHALSRERPALPRPLIDLGDVLRRHDRFEEAADAYSQALERIAQPLDVHWVVFYSRGISYEQSKQWPKAEADFLRALELSPDQPLALNYLGYSWLDQGVNIDRAFAMIKKAVEMRPRDGYIVDSLGWGLYRTGDYAEAVKQLERAVMLLPADPVVNDHLGDALWQVGRTREARFQWERALAAKPEPELAVELEKKLIHGLSPTKP